MDFLLFHGFLEGRHQVLRSRDPNFGGNDFLERLDLGCERISQRHSAIFINIRPFACDPSKPTDLFKSFREHLRFEIQREADRAKQVMKKPGSKRWFRMKTTMKHILSHQRKNDGQ
jgi:hypothetical protein